MDRQINLAWEIFGKGMFSKKEVLHLNNKLNSYFSISYTELYTR